MAEKIRNVSAATVRAELRPPVEIGNRVLTHREYAVVKLESDHGKEGWAFGLTRGGPVAEVIRSTLRGMYAGVLLNERERAYWGAVRSNPAVFSSGIGMRALSLIDLAAWDLAGKVGEVSVAELLGGANERMPATAIVGYPPNVMGPEHCASEVRNLRADGWRRFKAPIGVTEDSSVSRLRAMRAAAPDDWIGLDAAWTYRDAASAAAFLARLTDVRLGWFEDVFLPGDIENLTRLRSMCSVPIATGDDQSDSYFPGAVLNAKAADVVRFDLTCMGGITRGRTIVDAAIGQGIEVSPHIFGHVHSQFLAGLGHNEIAVEWGMPGTGVDPFSDSLSRPTIGTDGYMEAFPSEPGFGRLVNIDWVIAQDLSDPDHAFG